MKVALVTGATKGIGRAIGIDLLFQGYKVYFNHRANCPEVEELAKGLESLKLKNFEFIQADLSKISEIDKLKSKCIEKIDTLVLNAGITDRTPFENMTVEQWNAVLNTNLTVPAFITQQFKEKINKGGSIIFISSILGTVPHSQSLSYAVSKAGVNALVKNLVKYLSKDLITVNAVAPGFVNTNWHKDKDFETLKRIKNKISLNRFASSDEVAQLVMSVISNKYINGQVITIDGAYDYGEV